MTLLQIVHYVMCRRWTPDVMMTLHPRAFDAELCHLESHYNDVFQTKYYMSDFMRSGYAFKESRARYMLYDVPVCLSADMPEDHVIITKEGAVMCSRKFDTHILFAEKTPKKSPRQILEMEWD